MTDMPTVLVVEDEPMIRMLAADMLDVLGWSVLEAGLGAEAVKFAEDKGERFEAALIDLGLPDCSGEDLVHDLRRLRPGLPIIITTGRDERDMDADLRSGVVFLGKPYQLSDLEAAFSALKR
jgi:DNA-binding response OmpR family regulator